MSRESGISALVSRALGAGIFLAGVFLIAGLALGLMHPDQVSTRATPLPALWGHLLSGDPTAIMTCGLLLLLGTPVLRVVILLIAYSRKGEWLFAMMSLLVLAILGFSTVLGAR